MSTVDAGEFGLDHGEEVVAREQVVLGQRLDRPALAEAGWSDDPDGRARRRYRSVLPL